MEHPVQDDQPGISRRELLRQLAAAGVTLGVLGPGAAAAATQRSEGTMPALPRPLEEDVAGSHVGSLHGPIARIRDAYGWARESFASERYQARDHPAWVRRMRARVFEAMRYAPARADFAAEVVETVDCGAYRREKVYFNTTPELRVPAYVLVPKNHGGRAPGIIALHDHGGYYRFGKEKLVKLPDEHPHLTAFKGCINGLKDGLFPVESGVRAAYKTLETVYAKVGAADRFRGHLYDTPHEFNTEMQAEAWEWIRRWL